jgi:hypothetical protein
LKPVADGRIPGHVIVAAAVLLVTAGCGGSNLSMSEYGDRLNDIQLTYAPRAVAAWTEFMELPHPTTGDLKTLIDREVAIRIELEDRFRDLDPPAEVADLHRMLADWISALREAGEGLGARAGTVGGWDELLLSAEFREYEATLVGGAGVCDEFQARLDATAERGVFGDTPWVPADLREAADAVLGCDTIPEDLDAVFER